MEDKKMVKLEKDNPKGAVCASCGNNLFRTILIWRKGTPGLYLPLCQKCRRELIAVLESAKEK